MYHLFYAHMYECVHTRVCVCVYVCTYVDMCVLNIVEKSRNGMQSRLACSSSYDVRVVKLLPSLANLNSKISQTQSLFLCSQDVTALLAGHAWELRYL